VQLPCQKLVVMHCVKTRVDHNPVTCRGLLRTCNSTGTKQASALAGDEVLRQPCSAAVSADMAFDGARRRAYLGALDGTLSAFQVVYRHEQQVKHACLAAISDYYITIPCCKALISQTPLIPCPCISAVSHAKSLWQRMRAKVHELEVEMLLFCL
jgi:hypothetical protein